MTNEGSTPVRLECTRCGFARTVQPADDVRAADLIIEHGRETGHTLAAKRLERGEEGPYGR